MGNIPQLEYVLRGLKRLAAPASHQQRLPVTPPILRGLKRVWSALPDRWDATMLWAASTFGFLRSGEVVVPSDSDYDCQLHLSFRDVKVDDHRDPHFIEVRIKASKTDPFRKGVSVFIGKTG